MTHLVNTRRVFSAAALGLLAGLFSSPLGCAVEATDADSASMADEIGKASQAVAATPRIYVTKDNGEWRAIGLTTVALSGTDSYYGSISDWEAFGGVALNRGVILGYNPARGGDNLYFIGYGSNEQRITIYDYSAGTLTNARPELWVTVDPSNPADYYGYQDLGTVSDDVHLSLSGWGLRERERVGRAPVGPPGADGTWWLLGDMSVENVGTFHPVVQRALVETRRRRRDSSASVVTWAIGPDWADYSVRRAPRSVVRLPGAWTEARAPVSSGVPVRHDVQGAGVAILV